MVMTAMVAVAAVAMAFLYCMYIYVYVYNTCSASHLMFTSKALKMIRPSDEFKMNVSWLLICLVGWNLVWL